MALVCAVVGVLWFVLRSPGGKRAGASHPYFRCPCPLILAHQGASGHAPSNTLESFRLAQKMGADVLELDVHQSLDGHLVVAHDADVKRLTNGKGLLRTMKLAQIKALDAGYGFQKDGRYPFRGKGVRIPTLDEVFRAFPKLRINIEIKQAEPPIEAKLWALIRKHKAEDRVLVVSFKNAALESFRALSKGRVPTAASMRQGARLVLAWKLGLFRFWQSNIDALQFPYLPAAGRDSTWTTAPDFVAAVRKRKLHFHAWTVNRKEHIRALLKQGVDGLITDYPDRAMAELKQLGLRK